MKSTEKEKVQNIVKEKVEKHKEKLRLHEDSRKVLEIQREEAKQKLENLDSKILSSTKNIEYHTGKIKAYESISSIISE